MIIYLVAWFVMVAVAQGSAVVVALATGLVTIRRLIQLDLGRDWSFFLLASLTTFGATVLVTWLTRRWLDRRSLASLGLVWQASAGLALAFGVALGVALITLVFLVELATGLVRVHDILSAEPAAFWPAFVGMLLGFAFGAASEEIVSRGYVLQNLAEQFGAWPATVLSSALFALLHSRNPGVDMLAIAFLFGAGLLFAAAYYAGGSLWLPIGLHFGWNVAEGLIYGFPVSGLLTPRLIVTEQLGPALMTGDRFGPEGGLIILLALGLGLAALWLWRRMCLRITP